MSSSPSDFDMSVSESAGGEVRPSRIRRVFLGPSDIRAGWRLAMFILFFAALNFFGYRRQRATLTKFCGNAEAGAQRRSAVSAVRGHF